MVIGTRKGTLILTTTRTHIMRWTVGFRVWVSEASLRVDHGSPKPKALNPKPKALNLYTLNPKLYTLKP